MNDKNHNIESCVEFFEKLAKKLLKTHEVIRSCNNDCSAYLVPKGTAGEITYSSKPANSYRVSDHWNWYASISKCPDRKYVQCLNVDLPWPKKRKTENGASSPVWAACVAKLEDDGKYHCIFGEKFNKKTRTWEWVDAT